MKNIKLKQAKRHDLDGQMEGQPNRHCRNYMPYADQHT